MPFLANEDLPVLSFNKDVLDMAYAKEKIRELERCNKEISELKTRLDVLTKQHRKYTKLTAEALCPLKVGDVITSGAKWKDAETYKEYVVTSIHAVTEENGMLAERSAEKSPFGMGIAVRVVKLKKNGKVSKNGSSVLYVGLSNCQKTGQYGETLEDDLRDANFFERSRALIDVKPERRPSRIRDLCS